MINPLVLLSCVPTDRTKSSFDPHDISGQEDNAEKEDGKPHDEKEGLKRYLG